MSTNRGSHARRISESAALGASLLTALATSFALPALAMPVPRVPHEPRVVRELPRERPSERIPEGVKTEPEVPETHDENGEEPPHHAHAHHSHEASGGESCNDFILGPGKRLNENGEWGGPCPAKGGNDDSCPGYVKVMAPPECGFMFPASRWEAEPTAKGAASPGLIFFIVLSLFTLLSWREGVKRRRALAKA